MTGLRGFGLHIDLAGGGSRQWYAGADGVKRWADNDKRVGLGADTVRDDFAAVMQQGIPPMRPDDLDVVAMNNEGIDEIKASHEAAEDAGQMPRTNYTDGSK